MLQWDALYGTGVQSLQGLARHRRNHQGVNGMGDYTNPDGSVTAVNDDGSTVTTYPDGTMTSTPATDGSSFFSITGPAASPTSGASPQGDTSFWSGASNFFQAIIGGKQSYDINQINLERAKRGQALLTPQQIAQLSPQVRVNAGLQQGTQNTLLIVVGVIAAAIVLPKLLK